MGVFVHRLGTVIGAQLVFIWRPSRVDTSLMVSTLKALFSARRELFEGLAINKTDWKWEKYTIIHFEFNDLTTTSMEEFKQNLDNHVHERLEEAGYAYDRSLL